MYNKHGAREKPGEFILDELAEHGWTQAEFAWIVGLSPRTVNEIICGRRSISPNIAKAISAVFGTSTQFWMNLDTAYQHTKKRNV